MRCCWLASLQFGWLSVLKNSARNCRRIRSVIAGDLSARRSMLNPRAPAECAAPDEAPHRVQLDHTVVVAAHERVAAQQTVGRVDARPMVPVQAGWFASQPDSASALAVCAVTAFHVQSPQRGEICRYGCKAGLPACCS